MMTGEKKLDSPDRADIERILDKLLFSPSDEDNPQHSYKETECIDRIQALIEPLIEEAKKKIREEMYAQLQEVEDGLVERTKTQERERILELLPVITNVYHHNRTCFDCIESIKRQALKGE